MLGSGRTLVRLASRQRNGTKLLAVASQARCPAVQIKIEQDLHTNLDRNVSYITNHCYKKIKNPYLFLSYSG